MIKLLVVCLLLLLVGIHERDANAIQPSDPSLPPPPQREFRGVWVATVANTDWPSKTGLTVDQQKAELTAIMDRAVHLGLNAIVFQVRPSCDALYDSSLEPWSEYLSGRQGVGPKPYYDPLAFAIQEAHVRGLELHAWINPFRARQADARSSMAPGHISKLHPDLCKVYGKSLWLDPGEPAVRQHSLAVIADIVKRYDVDGIHLDDYFYPYRENDADGHEIAFPDDASWKRYQSEGGQLSRDDWRRSNVDTFIEQAYKTIKSAKTWVKFGISPFGIWRPGYPSQIKGLDAYTHIYADSRKWLENGWCDYFCPQLYWRIDQQAQSFPVLLKWWVDQNLRGRHLWPGSYTDRVGDSSSSSWPAHEIVDQVKATRSCTGASGNIQFSMKCLLTNRGGVADALSHDAYSRPALVPASPWLGSTVPGKPAIDVSPVDTFDPSERRISWTSAGGNTVWRWVIQTRSNGNWTTTLLPGAALSETLSLTNGNGTIDRIAVSAVDRLGNLSTPALADVALAAASQASR